MSNITGDGESFSSENNTGGEEVQQQQQLNGSALEQPPLPVKKKRNLPGTPDPAAEVIALSPTTLMATNRFVCEICNKGFQRDQNLQLHRRGHNLPWKLRQRPASAEVRKRVYVCPEPSCVHHNPSRALGDLTGIKKHFCRKHGEKKWKCDKCSKKYAVQSDWKAHSKTCGTREYKCDCGTIFSRRDSFVTHRAFCDALAEESNKSATNNPLQPPPPLPDLMIPITSAGSSASISISDFKHPMSKSLSMSSPGPAALFSLTNTTAAAGLDGTYHTVMNKMALMSGAHMSATALLQKAAQMGATASGGSSMMQQQMAGPDVRPYSYSEGLGRGYENQFFDGNMTNHEGSSMNENGIMFHQHQQQLHGRFLKSLEHESTSSSTSSNNNVNGGLNSMHNTNNNTSSNARTVDFMGVGGARAASLPQPFQLQQSTAADATLHGDGGILDKSMWGDV